MAAVAASPWYGQAAIWRSASLDGFSLFCTAFFAPLDGWTAIDISTDTLLLYNAGTGIWTGLITGVFSDAAFTLQDDIDPTKQARFQIAGFTAGATRVFTLPDVSSSVAVLSGVAQTFQNTTTFSATSVTVGSSTAASTR